MEEPAAAATAVSDSLRRQDLAAAKAAMPELESAYQSVMQGLQE